MDRVENIKPEIQDIFVQGASKYLDRYPSTSQQRKAIFSIMNCRGPVLGKHIDKCDHCGHTEISYNSCRNRHCPKCQLSKQHSWVNRLESSLPPVRYFHMVFTLPSELNGLVYKYQKLIYPLMFKASAEALQKVASWSKYLGAQTGCLSVLHTWGQNLQFHPHIHMLVPSGGLSEDDMEWISTGKKFFVPVKVLSKIFRGKFIEMLEELIIEDKVNDIDLPRLKTRLYKKGWVIYAKKTFAGPAQVLRYLGKYTHRVAISNKRIISQQDGKISFYWKNYKRKACWGILQLDVLEFIRRYLLHVLPTNFYKIRYYGILSLANRKQKLKHCFELIQQQGIKLHQHVKNSTIKNQQFLNYRLCPVCQVGMLKFSSLLKPMLGEFT